MMYTFGKCNVRHPSLPLVHGITSAYKLRLLNFTLNRDDLGIKSKFVPGLRVGLLTFCRLVNH